MRYQELSRCNGWWTRPRRNNCRARCDGNRAGRPQGAMRRQEGVEIGSGTRIYVALEDPLNFKGLFSRGVGARCGGFAVGEGKIRDRLGRRCEKSERMRKGGANRPFLLREAHRGRVAEVVWLFGDATRWLGGGLAVFPMLRARP